MPIHEAKFVSLFILHDKEARGRGEQRWGGGGFGGDTSIWKPKIRRREMRSNLRIETGSNPRARM